MQTSTPWRLSTVLFLLGLIAIFFTVPGVFDDHWAEIGRAFFRELGIVLCTVVVISILYAHFVAEPERLRLVGMLKAALSDADTVSATCARLGVKRILDSRMQITLEEITQRLENAREFELLGVSNFEILHQPRFRDTLHNHLVAQKQCRILLLDPDATLEIKRRIEEERDTESLKQNIEGSLRNVWKALDGVKVNLGDVVRVYRHNPTCMIMRWDHDMVVVPYLHGEFANSPALWLIEHPGGLFTRYKKHFDDTFHYSSTFVGWQNRESGSPKPALQPTGTAGG